MFVIKNVRARAVKVDGVDIEPGQQLDFQTISPDVQAAIDRGDFVLASGDETFAERKADAEAFKPFKTGDHAI